MWDARFVIVSKSSKAHFNHIIRSGFPSLASRRYDPVMTKPIYILGYGSLIWDLDDLAPKVTGDWRMDVGPQFPLEFTRISPKRKQALALVIDEAGDPCPSHAIRSIRGTVAEAADDLAARERTELDHIGWVDLTDDSQQSNYGGVADLVREWCVAENAAGAVWTDLNGNFDGFTVARGIDYLKSLSGESLAAAEEYINCAPVATDTPLRRALAADPWWQELTRKVGR